MILLYAGKKRRLTLLESPPDLPGMMDAAKVADLVLLLVDGSFGFEMETFEFLNLLQVGRGVLLLLSFCGWRGGGCKRDCCWWMGDLALQWRLLSS